MKTPHLAVIAVLFAVPACAETYVIDADHSAVTFRIKHLISKVPGRFTKFSGEFNYDPKDSKGWSANAEIDASSIDTNNEKRDKHLRSSDFFDVEKCPKITFKSTGVKDVKGDKGKLLGELTMHCVTKPVELDLEIGGVMKDPWGNQKAGAIATGKLNRKDFGIEWNKALDSGGLLLGNDVEITLEIEGAPKKK